jgi:Domain of unknown function (DUF6487)
MPGERTIDAGTPESLRMAEGVRRAVRCTERLNALPYDDREGIAAAWSHNAVDMAVCPFCGSEMCRGSIRLRGWYAQAVTAVFEPQDGASDTTQVLGPGSFRRGKRAASCCVQCDAVVVDPRAPRGESGPAVPRYGATEAT